MIRHERKEMMDAEQAYWASRKNEPNRKEEAMKKVPAAVLRDFKQAVDEAISQGVYHTTITVPEKHMVGFKYILESCGYKFIHAASTNGTYRIKIGWYFPERKDLPTPTPHDFANTRRLEE